MVNLLCKLERRIISREEFRVNLLREKQEVVLKSINRFGVITSTQLIDYLKGKVSHVSVYNTKKKLLSLGLIEEEKIGYQLFLYIKPRGVDYLGSKLTAFTKINVSQLKHQLWMNDCLLAFKSLAEKKGQDFEFITERELRSNYLTQNFSSKDRQNTTLLKKVPDRIPDFVLIEKGKRVACEVELTQKSAKRYTQKFARYKDEILNGDYDVVRYLCDDEPIMRTVEDYASAAGLDSSMFQRELIWRLLKIAQKE